MPGDRLQSATIEQTTDPLKILVASESSIKAANGVANSVRMVLKHLRDTGNEALVVCPKPAPDSYAGFEVITTRSVPFEGFSLAIPGPKKLARIIDTFEPNVVHAASPFWTLGKTAIRSALQQRVPSVAVYQTSVAEYSRRFNNLTATTVAEQRTARLHNKATRTLVPSTAAYNELLRYGVDPSRMFYWGRGVDLEQFNPGRRDTHKVHELREAIRGTHHKPIVGYVGRLAEEKSVERLACLKGLGVQLIIVGDGPTLPELKKKLPKHTIFTGELKGEALANTYASFDVFVHTGMQETFGQTLQEAMATGLPVVAPDIGGPLDIVQHGVTGYLYNHLDNESLRVCIAQLVDDEALRLEMGHHGRRAVESRSWSRIGDELLSHYHAAIASNN